MSNLEIIKKILLEETSKIDHVVWHFEYGDIFIVLRTKDLNPLLIKHCKLLMASKYDENSAINKRTDLIDYEKNCNLPWLNATIFWKRFRDETNLNDEEIKRLTHIALEEIFLMKIRWIS